MLRRNIKSTILVLILAAFIFSGISPCMLASAQSNVDVTVNVDNTKPLCLQTFQGAGGHLTSGLADYMGTERGMTDGDFQLLKARAKKMGITFARQWIWYDWFNPADGVFTYESNEMKGFYRYLDLYQSIGTDVLFQVPSGNPAKLYPWVWQSGTDGNAGPGNDSARIEKWATGIAKEIKYMHDKKGYTCVKYFSINNEPSATADYEAQLYKAIKQKFVSEKMDYIKVLAPDQVYYADYMKNFITKAHDYCDCYSYHCYQDDYKKNIVDIKNTSDPNGASKGLIFTEYGIGGCGPAANDVNYNDQLGFMHMTLNNMNAGFTGFAKWTLYDSFFDFPTCRANQTGTTDQDDACWGLWRSKDFNWMPRSSYYMFSLFTKFTKIGATQYEATSSDTNSITSSAVKNPDGNYSIFAVNTSLYSKTVQFNLNAGINKTLYRFEVDKKAPVDRWATIVLPSESMKVDGNFTDTIPANSFVAYTSDWEPSISVGTPGNLSVTNDKVPCLTWSAANDALYYRVYRGDSSDFNPSSLNMVGETADNKFADETVRDFSSTYYYKVIAVGKWEQTGSPTSAIQLGTYKFQNTLKCNSTDDGTNYTITSDKPDVGYQFKINKSTGLSKSFQDIEGNNAYAQVIFDRAHPGGAGNVDEAATVSTPSTQDDGSQLINVTNGSSSYRYNLYPDYVKFSASSNIPVDDYGYKDITKVVWADNTTSNVHGGIDLQKNTTGFTLVQNNRDYVVKFEFPSPKSVTISTDALKCCNITHPKFNMDNGDSYKMYFVKNVYQTYPTDPENLALNKTVTASSSFESLGFSKDCAVDGQKSTGWTSNDNLDSDHTEWIAVDLGQKCNINRVDLYPRNDSEIGAGFPLDFTIKVSQDNSNWTTVVTQTNYPKPGNIVQSFPFNSQVARYVKVEGTKLRQNPLDGNRYRMQLNEFEVYGVPVLTTAKATLDTELKKAATYQQKDYTSDSWSKLANAVEQGNNVKDGTDITKIEAASEAIESAVKGLVLRSNPSKPNGPSYPSNPVSPVTPVTPTAPATFVSDTNSALAVNNAYTFKITSMNGKAPTFVVGTPGVFTVQLKQTGNDYFYKITATGPVGAQAGIYVNGEKLLVATVKSAARTFVSDTNSNINVNSAYTFKITSKNGKAPTFVVGTPGTFDVKVVKHRGNDYYIQITAVGAPGTQTGIYINGGSPFLVATVGSNPFYVKSDTTGSFQVRAGKSYVFKLTCNAKPSFVVGTGSAFKVSFVKQSGKDYFFRVTAVGKAGQASGFYINHQARAAVATIA